MNIRVNYFKISTIKNVGRKGKFSWAHVSGA